MADFDWNSCFDWCHGGQNTGLRKEWPTFAEGSWLTWEKCHCQHKEPKYLLILFVWNLWFFLILFCIFSWEFECSWCPNSKLRTVTTQSSWGWEYPQFMMYWLKTEKNINTRKVPEGLWRPWGGYRECLGSEHNFTHIYS